MLSSPSDANLVNSGTEEFLKYVRSNFPLIKEVEMFSDGAGNYKCLYDIWILAEFLLDKYLKS